ncbi:MAG: Uncharacterised protein [Flavobacteriia bacterium]|nr:MAG: Uncharacterised protein [Flavobacteriia bacterium]
MDASGIGIEQDRFSSHLPNFLDHRLVVWRHELPAIGPIDLVAIVLRRVVARSDHDPALTTEVANGKTQERGRAEVWEKEGIHSVGREDLGCLHSKFP